MIPSLRYFYAAPAKEFLNEPVDSLMGKISPNTGEGEGVVEQISAWNSEIIFLKRILPHYSDCFVVFEFSIPRMGKRVDVALIFRNAIVLLEFKVGGKDFLRQDIEQVWDYALDLKNFHEPSHNVPIFPVLIETEAEQGSLTLSQGLYQDGVYIPLCINVEQLEETLKAVEAEAQKFHVVLDGPFWARGRYSPTPTIIQAASSLYLNHTVQEITRSGAEGEALAETTAYIINNVIDFSKQNHEKSICFLTGVPGAGKTLVGLNLAIEQFKREDLAVYLSGNGPLVEVLTEALARDKKRKDDREEPGIKHSIGEARRKVSSFIQSIHHYRDDALTKIKIDNGAVANGIVQIDPEKINRDKKDGAASVEHVAIFDEAQRSWDKDHIAGWLKRKKRISGFPMSEAEFLIWSMDLRPDWAVIICLVGGGQEINSGEAGISEWLHAIKNSFKDWNIFISNALTEPEYAEGRVDVLIDGHSRVTTDSRLHLKVNMRSFKAESVSEFVHALLECDPSKARALYAKIQDRYPIVITRDLEQAKAWLRSRARGSERYGLVVSSQAQRLRPLAIDVRYQPDTVHWFLDDAKDVRSSLFLEDASTEFDVQGLELDWTCLVWDADFRYSKGSWHNYSFLSSRWCNINAVDRKAYQLNAYRVLLTRARQGMVICVPRGDKNDETRSPDYYDGTYQYLCEIGLTQLPE